MKIILPLVIFLLLLNEGLQSQNAPVTTAGCITNAVPGSQTAPVPVSVTGFTNIGQFTLTMKFDTTRVRYVSSTTNAILTGMSVTYTPPSGNTQGKLVLAWTGAANVSLADGSSLANIVFYYVSGTGMLNWSYTFGSICQYKKYVGTILTPLSDTPKYDYYLNGGISNRTAPLTFAPAIANPVQGALPVAITANGFTTIGGFTLYLEYDPAIITYANSYVKNSAFGSAFQVGDFAGENGKRLIVIQWYGNSVTLASGATLCTLNFNYPAPNCNPCALTWFDNGPSCEYTDNLGDVLIDMPQPNYYTDGIVASGLHPTWTGNIDNSWDNPGNWNACGVPDLSRMAVIPDVAPNANPVLNSSGYCKSITVKSGATLSIGASGSITVGNN
jgi:hypothetical protein